MLVCQPEGLGSSPQLCPGDLVKKMVFNAFSDELKSIQGKEKNEGLVDRKYISNFRI